MQLEITRKAQVDILTLQDFGNTNFGVSHTRKYLADMRDTFNALRDWPEMARLRTEYGGTVRMHPFRSHLIFYRIEGDLLKVLRITSRYQDWPNRL